MAENIKDLKLMKILVVGAGGREHALAWKISQSPKVKKIYVAPGNAGTADFCVNLDIKAEEIDKLLDFARENKIDLTVVGPEVPLAMGIVDLFEKHNLPIFGPTKKASLIESSKVFAKKFMKKFKIPTAKFKVFRAYKKAYQYLRNSSFPKVIKADGLTGGKGAFVCRDLEEARKALKRLMVDKEFGSAGESVVIEKCLAGKEASVMCLTDGATFLTLPVAQDHKRLLDNDLGPNTGGMGAFVPSPVIDQLRLNKIEKIIIKPAILGMKKIGRPFKGVLYAGIMITDDGPKVLEFNCRFGDPETQPQMLDIKSDLVDLLLACVEGKLERQKLIAYRQAAACIVMASEGYPGHYETGLPISGLINYKGDRLQIFHAGTRKEKGMILTNGGRVIGVTARNNNLKEAVNLAYQEMKKIKFKNQYYRTDIGLTLERKIANRIEINYKIADARAEIFKNQFKESGFSVNKVWAGDVYTINKEFKPQDLEKIAKMLSNPVVQNFSINEAHDSGEFNYAIEVGYLPGVTDNVGQTAKESIEDLLKTQFKAEESVYTSQIIYVKGNLSETEIKNLAESLINPLIQRVSFKNYADYQKENGMAVVVPQVKLTEEIKVYDIDLNVSDEELQKIGKQGIANSDGTRRGPLALDLSYMKSIQTYFKKKGRKPTDIELESLAQTWSEHCKHTIFADPLDELKEGLFKTYIKKATEEIRKKLGNRDFCVSVFKDNSGAIEFDENHLITHKIETHNSPSALDPFGGSITGIVGVNRDAIGFGLGAKPIINQYGYCFADPNDSRPLYRGPDKTQKMLSPKRILEGVVKGVNTGGNCSGIPTTQGFVFFDESYKGKPLVFVGTAGLIPKRNKDKLLYEKGAQAGDYIVMAGGRVGQDGIHGATFSSESLSTGSPATAVQIGDPITQKKLSDAIVKEARDLDLFDSITDNGAGGLSSSVAEMAKECGGCEVELDKVPLKYPGMVPWQIWVSESQERMTLSVPPEKWPAFLGLMNKRGVEATVIGSFKNSGQCVVKYNGQKIVDLEMRFLHDGLPLRPRKTKKFKKIYREPQINKDENPAKTLLEIIGRPNISGFAFISGQYDHEVQGGSIIKPLQGAGRVNGEVSVVRPLLSSNKAVILAQGLNPRYSLIDTYGMAASAIDTAIRNAVSAGANPDKLALLDNFCWCSSEEPERLWQLKQACQACHDYATAYETPFISGKDSMFNDFKGFDEKSRPVKISILPTLLITAMGVVDDWQKTVSLDLKIAGDLIYLLGDTNEEMAASEYYDYLAQKNGEEDFGSKLPQVNAQKNKKLYRAYYQAVERGLIASGISVGRGGLAVALAKTGLAGNLGLEVNLKKLQGKVKKDELALFSESQGRIVVSVPAEKQKQFESLMKDNSLTLLGKATDNNKIKIRGLKGQPLIETRIIELARAYRGAFKNFSYKTPPKTIVLSGYGLNCEEETKYAFDITGGQADIVHINDLIENPQRLMEYQIMAIPGGFSYGDDTGSGNAFANRLRNHLWSVLLNFIQKDKLIIGICNGFQILTNLGLLPALGDQYGEKQAALTHNNSARYTVRWVDLQTNASQTPWLKNIHQLSLPIAHGEGKFYSPHEILNQLNEKNLICLKYIYGEICDYQDLPANPNGSLQDIAGITDESGRILGLMPHPERAIFFHHLPNWQWLKEKYLRSGKKIPEFGPGLQIFKNGVEYFIS